MNQSSDDYLREQRENNPEFGLKHPSEGGESTSTDNPLAQELIDLRNDSENPYLPKSPIGPVETGQPVNTSENQPGAEAGDREVLNNQRQIIEGAHQSLDELGRLASESGSDKNPTELNDRLKSALAKAEQDSRHPDGQLDHRLVADRLRIVDELSKLSHDIAETYQSYEDQLKQLTNAFTRDAKDSFAEFERAIDKKDPDTLELESDKSLDRLGQDHHQMETLQTNFTHELSEFSSKLKGLDERYSKPMERMSEKAVDGGGVKIEAGQDVSPPVDTTSEATDVTRGIDQFQADVMDDANKLAKSIDDILEAQEEIISRVEVIKNGARKYETDDESTRRTKAERLESK